MLGGYPQPMAELPATTPELVSTLLPSLSRSLTEQFNVFRVMHHGTHEKQMSNVFAWLLDSEARHELGELTQQIFLGLINATLPEEAHLPLVGYHITQEVATTSEAGSRDDAAADIADIVLSRHDATVVVENFGTSDGHGHDYQRYLAHGSLGGRAAVVVLLCQRKEPHLLRDGWELAAVVTYAEILLELKTRIAAERRWRRDHSDQHSFIRQMFEHFVEGPSAMNLEDTIGFLTKMCETGESARYGHRPRDVATQEFVDLIAEHARRQLEDSRTVLATTKRRLREYSRSTLVGQVNAKIPHGPIERVVTRFVGQWEWTIELHRADEHRTVFFHFGPTAVVELQRVPNPLDNPDYSRLFVSLQGENGAGISSIEQTDVPLLEVLEGLDSDDVRLRDAVLNSIAQG